MTGPKFSILLPSDVDTLAVEGMRANCMALGFGRVWEHITGGDGSAKMVSRVSPRLVKCVRGLCWLQEVDDSCLQNKGCMLGCDAEIEQNLRPFLERLGPTAVSYLSE
jgi:hypothetical protein